MFGEGGGEALAARVGVPLLARIPLVERVRVQGDAGTPVVIAAPELPVSALYRDLARRVAAAVDQPADSATAC